MTSPLSFSSRLCFKLLKRLSYSCQCLLTHVFLLHTDKVCRWKIFSLLAWFPSTIHLSLLISEVSYKPFTSHTTSFFLSSSTSSSTPFVCETFLDWICQHWLLYNKLSSNNNNNNNHHVSVVQVCVSELTTCRALILYDTYIVTLILVNADVNSVLFIDQQQLACYTHFSQTMVILALLSVNVLFVQQHVTLNQVRTHQLSYINTILIQSQSVLISVSCINCQTHNMTFFLKCHCTSEHFNECCDNCKWHDHAAHCFVHNNDVLIVILNDENDNDVNEGEHAAQSRQITSTLLTEVIVIYIDS